MKLPYPWELYSDLSNDRLEIIAITLLDIRHITSTDMNSRHDCNYTYGSTTFGRSRNAIIEMAEDPLYPWLSIRRSGMGLTFKIVNIPCRFFTDDSNNPKKKGFFKRHAVDNPNYDLFSDNLIQAEAEHVFRFIVEKGMTDDDEARVVFAIYNGNTHEKISEWIYETLTRVTHPVSGRDAPTGVEIPPVSVDVLEDIEIPPVSVDVLEDDDLDTASHE